MGQGKRKKNHIQQFFNYLRSTYDMLVCLTFLRTDLHICVGKPKEKVER